MADDSDKNGATDAEEVIDLSDVRWDDSIVFVVFWVLAFVVFLQFFTRYILNDSLGWTEEIARYLLIAVAFIGSVMAVRKRSHIAVEFLYRWAPRPMRRVCQSVIDLVCIAFYGGLTWFSIILAGKTRQAMVSIDVPKALVYWIVVACFAAMTLYAIRIAWRNLTTGTSPLIDPEKYEDTIKAID
ncbi:MAG: TRAP transporter small permease [Paracoccaceae bacterium]